MDRKKGILLSVVILCLVVFCGYDAKSVEIRAHNRSVDPEKDSYQVIGEQSRRTAARVDINLRKKEKTRKLEKSLKDQVKHGGVVIGDQKKPDFVIQPGNYIPASIIKIATAAASLEILGEKHRFHTNIYVDAERNLYLKGFGDPSLMSEDWHIIADKLKEKGVFKEHLNDLVIDDTVFFKNLEFDGRINSINYFYAPLGALVSNYNTVGVRIGAERSLTVVNDNTPITEMLIKRIKGLPRGYQHINIAVDSLDSAKYSGELAMAIFQEHGAFFDGHIKVGKTAPKATVLYVHHSRQILNDIVRKMLKDSNNFIANQLLLAIALKKYGENAGIQEGVIAISAFIQKKVGISEDEFEIVEGSGLSKKNRIGLLAMLKIVNYFEKHRDLLPQLRSSKYKDLARVGRKWNIRAKTGTLKNVSTLAGFIQLKDKTWKPFAIMLGQDLNSRGIVMETIGRYYYNL